MVAATLPMNSVRPSLSASPEAPASETQLILLARKGDLQARETLAQQLRRPAFLLALQLLGNRDDALDCTQESLLRFFSKLHLFEDGRPILPWLRRIVRNRAIDMLRRKKVRRADSLDSCLEDEAPIEVPDTTQDTHRTVHLREQKALVWSCVQALSQAQREIIILRDYQDLSYQEISETLEVPMGTVMSRLHRARAELRKKVCSALDGSQRG